MDGSGLNGVSLPHCVEDEEDEEEEEEEEGAASHRSMMKVHGGSPQGRTPDPAGRCLPCRLRDGCVVSGDRGGLNGCGTPGVGVGVGVGVGRTRGGGGEGRHAVPRPAVLGEESGDPSAPGLVSETSPGPLRACGVPDSDDGTPGHRTGDGVSPPDQRQVNCACAAGPGLPGDRDGEAPPPAREEAKLANGGFHVISTSRDDRGGGQDPAKDSPFPGPGPALRTPSPPPSPGSGWAVRPQSLGTWGGAAGSLSCDATPLSPGDGGEAYLGAGRRQSAPDPLLDPLPDLLQDPPLDPLQDPPEPSDLAAPKRFAIADFFSRSLFSRKTKEPMVPTQNATGWRLFGKAAPESDAGQQRPLPPGRRKQLEFEPQSTTALILEDRPGNLPAKCEQEAHRHKQEYLEMVAGARRREVKEAQRRKRQMKERHRQEESISHAINTWNTHILPHWDEMKCSRRVRELWWQGLPPSVRGRVWSLAIGNDLNITPELYDIFLCRVKDRWRCSSETSSVNDSESDGGASLADRESSLDLIKLDISRTFPSLFIFQKGGPYHDVLHRLLGAYTCYRPDIGYVQGMSFIAAVLILNMEEAEVFITFSNLLNKPCQLAFYRVDHDLMLKYFAAFEVFFEENLPRLFRHFLDNNLTPDLYLIDWLFTLYSRALPLDVACRVWDVFCRDGEESLFRTALGVLRLYQDVLLQMDFIHMAQFLTRLPPDLPPHLLFSSMANTHMVSRAGRWAQVFSSLMKDGNKETDKNGSPALRS